MTIDFSVIDSAKRINSDWVLARVSAEQIFFGYFGKFVPYKETYSSVFRKDRTPSTGFYYGKESGKLKYHDMATGESWDCFSFVAQMYGINYYEAVKKVACDFSLIQGCGTEPLEKKVVDNSIKFDVKDKKEKIIEIEPIPWNLKHKRYWQQYEISREELEREDVIPINRFQINDIIIDNKDEQLRFAYRVVDKGKTLYKIYSPLADKSSKWISNIPLHVPFGFKSLNMDSMRVVVTKSIKDLIILKKIFPSVIATQNESQQALNEGLVKFLLEEFEERIIIFDNDERGVTNCTKFNEKGFGYWNVPYDYYFEGIKDAADVVKGYGLNKLKELLKQKNLL